MGIRGLTARKLCVTIIALFFACAAAFAFLFAPTAAGAEESSTVPNIELGAIGETYIIGDASVSSALGAESVRGDADKYGWYVYSEVNNTYRYTRHDIGWEAAMSAVTSADNRVRVVLASDWIAQPTEREVGNIKLYTSFGADEKVFPYGRLEIPQGMYMQLDLNGNVIDRRLRTPDKIDNRDYESEYAGVIYCQGEELEIVDSEPNKTHNGEYDYQKKQLQNESVSVNGGIIAGSRAFYGALNVIRSKVVIRGGTITNNGRVEYGGGGGSAAIQLSGSAVLTMLGGKIVNNANLGRAGSSGTGVCLKDYSVFNMYDGEIADNAIGWAGGGVCSDDESVFNMYGGYILRNTAKSYGGGVYAHGFFNLYGGEIANNSVDTRGGGIYVAGGEIQVCGGKISNNTAPNGGGIYIVGNGDNTGENCISGGEISGNTAKNGNGGGIYVEYLNLACMLTVTGVSITKNNADYGGGIYMGQNGYCAIGDCVISENTSANNGSGVCAQNGGKAYIYGNLRVENNKNTATNAESNLTGNMSVCGKLEDGARIGISVGVSNITASDYKYFNNDVYTQTGKYEGEEPIENFGYNYVIDPNKYFFSDIDGYIILPYDSTYWNGIQFEKTSVISSLPVFKTSYSADASAELQQVNDFGVTYVYEKGFQVKFSVTVEENDVSDRITVQRNSGADYNGEIKEADTYYIRYDYSSSKWTSYAVTILPQDITSEAVTATLSESEYEYDGQAKEPSVTNVTYNGTALTANKDYEITYKNNTDAGTGYAVINFKGNYNGKKELPFEINITGGQYNVAWEYYNGTAWTEVTEQTKFEYIPGYRGNQTNKVRAKLTLKGAAEQGEVVKYAYADGVTEYNDANVTESNISEITVKYTYNEETVAAFRNAGEYTVWLNGESDYPIGGKHETPLNMTKYEIQATDERLSVKLLDNELVYDGAEKRPTVKVVLDYLVLYEGIDYMVTYSDSEHEEQAINGGEAKAEITFIGNYSGTTEITFEISQAVNNWDKMPNIVRWTYGNFKANETVIIAQPKYLLPESNVHISILTGNGETIEGLEDIEAERVVDNTYGECYKITNETIQNKLNELQVNRYILRVWVDGTSSYTELDNEEIVFNVLRAENQWEESPSIESWITGEYDETKNTPTSKSKYGQDNVVITITNETGEYVYYDNSKNLNLLSSMPTGLYIMTAEVKGTDNYTGLKYTNTFRVFDIEGTTVIVEEGMPWWGVLLIVFGVIAIIVAVMVILHVKGVLQLITGKMVIKMRAKADVDATIAAIKAGRMAAAATTTTATTTEDNEKKTEKKAKALEKKAKTPEEKAAELEAKAKAMRKKAEAMKAKAKVIVMTPEEKKAMKAEERAKEKEKTRVKSPEEKAEALEKKAEANEAQAEQLKARAEVMKNRANEMREKSQKRKDKQQDNPTQQEEA